MFYFVKRLSALRIVTKPCADSRMLFGRFPRFLHHALDVSGFGGGKDGLVLLRTEMDNRIYGSPEYFVGLVEHIRKQAEDMPACFQRILQQADGLVLLRRGLAHRLADAPPLTVLLLLKCRTALSLSMVSKRLCTKALYVSVYCGYRTTGSLRWIKSYS